MAKFFIIIINIILLSCSDSNADIKFLPTQPQNNSEKILCTESGGNWEMLKDGCGDKCYRYEKERIICTMAFKAGCNCGANSCVDNKTKKCRPISSKISAAEEINLCHKSGGKWNNIGRYGSCNYRENHNDLYGRTKEARPLACNCGEESCVDNKTKKCRAIGK